MATIQKYEACTARNKSLDRSMNVWRKIYAPPLNIFFGKEDLIDESELDQCSESEKKRHLREDEVLDFLYIKN